MMNNKILIIGLTWPEPDTTAAGTRMMQLIDFFIRQGNQLTFVSAASKSELSYDLSKLPVTCHQIELNKSLFDEQIKDLDPGIVLFDRFLTEEQYGWRVQESCPEAIRILDTEDLHFLRKARELALQQGTSDWMDFIQNDTTLREIASIFRCDLSLIISKSEMALLTDHFNLPSFLLYYLPFLPESLTMNAIGQLPDYELRNHFLSIGNFNHKPNLDAFHYLRNDIWPLIRKELPEAELHIFGAYAKDALQQYHNDKSGFLVKGWAADKSKVFSKSRVCLAPLRFGAGQKGKLLDAMYFGTPSVTTSIGAEGMAGTDEWNGFVEDDPQEFAAKAVTLYKDKRIWMVSAQKGFTILDKYFNKMEYESDFNLRIRKISEELQQQRSRNFIGKMLCHHTMKSTKYLSKWIETKNLANNNIIDQQPPATHQ